MKKLRLYRPYESRSNRRRKVNDLYVFGHRDKHGTQGEWVYVLVNHRTKEKIVGRGTQERATHHEMILTATLEGLKKLDRPVEVVVHTANTYLIDGLNRWLPIWIGEDGKIDPKRKNHQLWDQLRELAEKHRIKAVKIIDPTQNLARELWENSREPQESLPKEL